MKNMKPINSKANQKIDYNKGSRSQKRKDINDEKSNSDRGDKPNYNRDNRGEKPYFSSDSRSEKPNISRVNRGEKTNFSRDNSGEKPYISRDSRSKMPYISRDSKYEKPNISRDNRGEKSYISRDNNGEKTNISRNYRGEKPNFNRDSKSEKSYFSRDDRGGKPQYIKGERTENNSRQEYKGDRNFKRNDNDVKIKRPYLNPEKVTVKKGACPYLKECGGCNILVRSYEEELKEKQKWVENLIKDYCKVEPIIGMKQPEHYRNKVHVVFDHDRKGNPISGEYEEGTHRVVPVETCLIHNQKADAIIASIRGMLKSFKIRTYDEDTGYGLLRHVLIKTGFVSGEIMVVLVLASPILPSKNNFVKALLKQHPEITTIVLNVNDRNTNLVLGNKEQILYGKGYIEDSLCGKVFRISPKSFYQVNPAQTEVLYGKAIEMAGFTGNETVIDAYCGIGTIGIIASGHVKKVIGVELNKDAVKDATLNAKMNNVTNIDFYNNDASEFMSRMAEENGTADVVIMDPPRTGSDEKFLDAVATIKTKKIIYVSCNPITLERDLNYLVRKGYRAVMAQPVDMFPWTGHTECCCLLKRA